MPPNEPTDPRLSPEEPTPSDAPVTFVPHEPSGAVSGQPVKIRAGRYGDLETHELVRLLDSIEDERARGRFRESIYISVFFYLALAWFIFYGPRVLWHAPQLKLPSDVLRERELTTLNAPLNLPNVTRTPQPRVKPAPPRVDTHTLDKLREMDHRSPSPQPATPQPNPSTPSMTNSSPNVPMPNAPEPQPSTAPPTRKPPPPVADAPLPQPNANRPGIDTSRPSAGDMIRQATEAPHGGTGYPPGAVVARAPGGGSAGQGAEILSDTQGVNFNPYLARLERDTTRAWLPLLPEEVEPPLMKKGETYIRITILPDGTVSDMVLEGSTHDRAIDHAAWGSILSQGKMQPLPREFHGPNLVLRLHYLVNMDR